MIKELTKPRYDVDIADEPDIDVLWDKHENEYIDAREASKRLNELEAENKQLRKNFAEFLAPYYLQDRAGIAKICDEQIDRTGELLGYVRDAAALTAPREG